MVGWSNFTRISSTLSEVGRQGQQYEYMLVVGKNKNNNTTKNMKYSSREEHGIVQQQKQQQQEKQRCWPDRRVSTNSCARYVKCKNVFRIKSGKRHHNVL